MEPQALPTPSVLSTRRDDELTRLTLELQDLQTQIAGAVESQNFDQVVNLALKKKAIMKQIAIRRLMLAQKPYVPVGKADVLVVGNPGAGKSTLLNMLATKVLFMSGGSRGTGLTRCLDIRTHAGQNYIDTPGLADRTVRKAAGEAISKRLRAGGKLQILFVVQQNSGRIINEDQVTLKIILEAAPEIGSNFGVIVNQVPKSVMHNSQFGFATKSGQTHFANVFQSVLPPKLRTDKFFFCERSEYLDGVNNILAPLPEKMLSFIKSVSTVSLKPNPAINIDTKSYEDLVEKTKKLEADRRAAEQKAIAEAKARAEAEKKAQDARIAQSMAEADKIASVARAKADMKVALAEAEAEKKAALAKAEADKQAAVAQAYRHSDSGGGGGGGCVIL